MNDKEEMIIVKDNPNLIVINQLPVISEQLDMVKAEIQRRTAFADTVTVSEENRQEIKKMRAAMNAEKSRLDDVYKTAIEKVIAPIQAVQDKSKDCVGLYTKANSQLKAKIDVIEDGLKLAKENSVKEYFEELVTAKNIDFISFEQLGLKITLSVSEKKLKEQVNNIVERVATDLKAIDIQEDKEEILVEYKKHLNVSEAVSTVAARHKAIPAEKERKIIAYIKEDLSEGEALTPFRNLLLYLRDHSDKNFFINQRIDECIKFLSFIKMTDQQLVNPDYHQLFELFLSKYDAKSRFDFGAYYTPKALADFVVKLTNYVVSKNFPGKSIYDDGNTIIDPCCGTGSFMEEVINHDPGNGAYTLCGIEILPAPYMLANYRMAVLKKQDETKRNSVHILLANTLSNSVFNGDANKDSIEGRELLEASRISNMPLKLVIGNPPCSDTIRDNTDKDFSIINHLMEDFRPPKELRRGRQNIQKQINNPFMQFLRWSCKKLLDSPNHSVLSLVVPLSFLEAESYKYARKYLCENFSDAWIVSVDADARTGARSDSLFHTLQGRAVIVLTRKYRDDTSITKLHYCDYSHCMRINKEQLLNESIEKIVSRFDTYDIANDTFAFSPTKPFNTEMYKKFWPVSGEKKQAAIFINHCSGIKLAPTAMFTHVKAPMLKRRSRDIAINGATEASAWFAKQDKPPKIEKIIAFENALNECENRSVMGQTLADNIKPYSFRPFFTSNVLLWKELLVKYSHIGGGGTRLRPEIISAYSHKDTIGFAMAHAPKDLNPTLSQFVSFCWYYPDNDMCTRGNSHIYVNKYPDKKSGKMLSNISADILHRVMMMLGKNERESARDLVFYIYAVLCSQVYLDEFEGALFTVNQSDKRARVPVVADKDIFLKIARIGEKIAELEKVDYIPENILNYDYDQIMEEVPVGFELKNVAHPFDAENEQLLLTDGEETIRIKCPLSLQRLNISGYDVIKSVWLKFNSYDFTHCEFNRDDMKKLLNFLNTIATHEKMVKKLDEEIAPVLAGEVKLIEYQN